MQSKVALDVKPRSTELCQCFGLSKRMVARPSRSAAVMTGW
jgi:hypothetical protein